MTKSTNSTVFWSDREVMRLKMLYGTMSIGDIADAMERSANAVSRKAYQLKLKPKHGTPDFIANLPPEQLAWIQQAAPKGTTVDEFVRAIITDAYLDAMEGGA